MNEKEYHKTLIRAGFSVSCSAVLSYVSLQFGIQAPTYS